MHLRTATHSPLPLIAVPGAMNRLDIPTYSPRTYISSLCNHGEAYCVAFVRVPMIDMRSPAQDIVYADVCHSRTTDFSPSINPTASRSATLEMHLHLPGHRDLPRGWPSLWTGSKGLESGDELTFTRIWPLSAGPSATTPSAPGPLLNCPCDLCQQTPKVRFVN